jgi:2-methylisocitrate lyase-like PEP mutase family enzyme
MSSTIVAPSVLNGLARTLKGLHVPGKPIALANSYDFLSTQAIASVTGSKALATASYGVARANGTEDDDMDMETNLAAAALCAKAALAANKPLTVDFQDGYGDRLKDGIRRLIEVGVVGINLEDYDRGRNGFFPANEAVQRIKDVLQVAKDMQVPEFVVNARCDVLVQGGRLEDVLTRGKQYLDAGATSIFVWGGSQRGVNRDEVAKMVEAFGGRLNVAIRMSGDAKAVTIKEAAELGVSRLSIGPQLQFMGMDTIRAEAEKWLATA